MFPLTLFLAKVLGLYFLAMGCAMAANKKALIATVNEIMRTPPLLMLSAIIALAMGLALVIGHNIWTGGALPLIVTLIGWASLFKGLVFLFIPGELSLRYYAALQYEKYFYIYVSATLLTGIFLVIQGFAA
jgi:ribose/xylose/arabinose/galactoside ABC-type transport system permease subunit